MKPINYFFFAVDGKFLMVTNNFVGGWYQQESHFHCQCPLHHVFTFLAAVNKEVTSAFRSK